MRILLAIDETGPSLLAARFARRLYRELREAEIVVVHVHPEGRQEDGERNAKEACGILEDEDVPYTLEVGPGDPAELIVARAQEHHCDVIVIGSRQMGPVKNSLLGSVSGKVVKESTVPVTLVS